MASAMLQAGQMQHTQKIGLLNMGTEDSKGNNVVKEASSLLKSDESLNMDQLKGMIFSKDTLILWCVMALWVIVSLNRARAQPTL